MNRERRSERRTHPRKPKSSRAPWREGSACALTTFVHGCIREGPTASGQRPAAAAIPGPKGRLFAHSAMRASSHAPDFQWRAQCYEANEECGDARRDPAQNRESPTPVDRLTVCQAGRTRGLMASGGSLPASSI